MIMYWVSIVVGFAGGPAQFLQKLGKSELIIFKLSSELMTFVIRTGQSVFFSPTLFSQNINT